MKKIAKKRRKSAPIPSLVMDKMIKYARRLRKEMTPEEVKLWVNLKSFNGDGFHFRRQVPMGNRIADFADLKHRLIIEVDGSQHGSTEGVARDTARDDKFAAAGYLTLRFWNIDINTAMDGVIDRIREALEKQER